MSSPASRSTLELSADCRSSPRCIRGCRTCVPLAKSNSGVHGVNNVHRRQTFGLQRLRIQIHGDLPLFPPYGKGSARPVRGQLVRIKLLPKSKMACSLRLSLVNQSELPARGGGVDGDQRRGCSGAEISKLSARSRGLRQRGLHIGVRLKINLNHRDTI